MTPQPDLDELRASCTRFLNGHGARTPKVVLSEIDDVLGEVKIDRYGNGGVVAELEDEVKALLGKPAAVFMPSGTMAQQIALRVHVERTGREVVLWHPTCHLQLHEGQGAERLHHIRPRTVGDARRLLTIDDLEDVAEYAGVLLLELPQREIGGQLPGWGDLVAQTELARSHGTALHLDGARLLESLPHYGRSAAEVAELFDSVYLSLYKGLGGLAGCVLAGDEQLVAEAKEWRLRHGGRLFAMWPYAAAGLAGLRRRAPLMSAYAEHAKAVSAELVELDRVSVVPDPPVTNMAHLYLRADLERFASATRDLAHKERIWTWGGGVPADMPSHLVVEMTVGDATMDLAPAEVREIIAGLLERSQPDQTA